MRLVKDFTISNIKRRYYGLFIGLILTVVGGFMAVPGLVYQYQLSNFAVSTPTSLTSALVTPVKADTLQGRPVRLIIPSLNVSLPIADGYYDAATQSWSISHTQAFFATTSSLPNNETGTTYIYGHNTKKIFSVLPKVEAGAQAQIETDNGYRFNYVYRSREEIKPRDVSILADQSQKPELLLQTCSGLWNQNRLIFSFDFLSVQKITN